MAEHLIFVLGLFSVFCLCTASVGIILVSVFEQIKRRNEGKEFYDEED